MEYTYKLVSFNIYDAEPAEINEQNKRSLGGHKEFLVQMFGINEKGETATIYVEDYTPFFYVKVPDYWKEGEQLRLINQIRSEMGEWYDEAIVSYKLIKKKKLYGFDGGKDHTFILIKLRNEKSFNKARRLWYTYTLVNGKSESIIDPDGYECGDDATYLYEGNIPPLLRLFHVKEISPSGWIALPKKNTLVHKEKTTLSDNEYTISYKKIVALNKKETSVPYKICSFDIEASSSHGDFPLAKKNYKKLAEDIATVWMERDEYECTDDDMIYNIILGAFGVDGYDMDGINIVYTKNKIDEEDLYEVIEKWIQLKPALNKDENQMDNEDIESEDDDDDNEIEEGVKEEIVEEVGYKKKKIGPKNYKKKEANMIDMLNDKTVTRDTLILELTNGLDKLFPKLKGDEVTFIGSTFLKYGEDKPYLNHCIAKGSCNKLDNCVIESYSTEKKVLLAWTDLMERENPDIVIGYNIMGFDWLFMYNRGEELGITKQFLKLSRNKKEICLSKKWNWNKNAYFEGMEVNSIFIASGQHDIKYIKMPGRIQIDLYNYFRRDYNLIKYKLDYVASYFIGDKVNKTEYTDKDYTKVYSKNLTGLENGNYVMFEEEAHSTDCYKEGKKFQVGEINYEEGSYMIYSKEEFDMNKKVKWGLAKDDVTPQDIFRMTNEGPAERAIIAKYCIQDCNLVHHLMRKIDVITSYTEMACLCSVPMEFLVLRGQGIKLTSYISKKCREKNTLMPTISKELGDSSYEGAIVLPPKCDLYLDDPVACVDYSSLYPSSMISENISHDSKVWTKEYNLEDELLIEIGERDEDGVYIYDNLEDYEYVDITYDTYRWQHKNNNPKAAMEKVKVGYKTCRFAQFPEGKGIMPSILEELLVERKRVRKLGKVETDPFMANIFDKRQSSIKVTANSLYGQTGAKTSTFYEVDCAASTTATGRKLLTYAQRVIEEGYKDKDVVTKSGEKIKVNAEYVYGDTDSVFFKFNPQDCDGKPIKGQKALELTIDLAQEAGELATKFLKNPHDLEYEKTYLPFCLLSKKRYVGMLYELNPEVGYRKSMGIVLKRRDNAAVVKDVYGGIIDILMKDRDVEKAVRFLRECLKDITDEKYPIDKLIITKSLRGYYKNPKTIAHNVLANRIGKRDTGNKPSIGDRISYIYIKNPDKKALQGERIETPEFIKENDHVEINYSFYITNQIMKPVQQVFALVLENLVDFKKKKGATLHRWHKELADLREKYPDQETYYKKVGALRNKEVKTLLFSEFI